MTVARDGGCPAGLPGSNAIGFDARMRLRWQVRAGVVAPVCTALLAIAGLALAPTPGTALGSADSWLAGGHWTRLSSESMGRPVMAIDSARDRVLLVAGFTTPGEDLHVRELQLATDPGWRLLRFRGSLPGARYGHSVVLDAGRHRLLMFGGRTESSLQTVNDVWALPLSAEAEWEAVPTVGTPPTPRSHPAAIYDPVRDRMIVFGGEAAWNGTLLDDLWELSLAGTPTWTRLLPIGAAPPPVAAAAAIFDPIGDRLVLYTGADVWSLALSGPPAWTSLAPGGPTPPTRGGPLAIYDRDGQRMVVHGGGAIGPSGARVVLKDTWALALSGPPEWTLLAPDESGPSGSGARSAVHDAARLRMLVSVRGDLWELPLSGPHVWSKLYGHVEFPAGGRREGSAVYDPLRDRVIVFGGDAGWPANEDPNDVWAFSLDSPNWAAVQAAGVAPEGRRGHVAIFDPPRDRMLIFGGYSDGSQTSLDDLWQLEFGEAPTWSLLTATGTPPLWTYLSSSAAYDHAHDRILVFVPDADLVTIKIWELSLGNPPGWKVLATSGTPPSWRYGVSVILDSRRARLVVFGGVDAYFTHIFNDAWALSLSGTPTWSPIAIAGDLPFPRWGHTAVHDGRRDRMIVFGGSATVVHDEHPWALSLGDDPAWAPLMPDGGAPPWRWTHAGIADSLGDRMIIFGGETFGSAPIWLGDVWEHRWTGYGTTVGEQAPAKPMVARGAARIVPGPVSPLRLELDSMPGSSGAVPLAFELITRSRASLVVHDVSGRRVRTLADGAFEPGRHALTWDRRDAHGRAVAGGIYFVSLVTDEMRITRNVVVLP